MDVLALSGLLGSYKQKHYHFLSVLISHSISQLKEGRDEFFKPIDSLYLSKHYSSKYRVVIQQLQRDGIVRVDRRYSNYEGSSFPMSYALSEEYIEEIRDGNIEVVVLDNKPLIKNTAKWREGTLRLQQEKALKEGEDSVPYKWIHREREMMLGFRYDVEGAREWMRQEMDKLVEDGFKKAYYHYQLTLFESLSKATTPEELPFSYVKGRVYSPLTSLKRGFREFVMDGQGSLLKEADLTSSHLKFLCKLIATALRHDLMRWEDGEYRFSEGLLEGVKAAYRQDVNLFPSYRESQWSSDFQYFIDTVFKGLIYEEYSEEFLGESYFVANAQDGLMDKESRKQHKYKFIKEILFDYYTQENKQESRFKNEFKERFAQQAPTVFAFIKECARQARGYKRSSPLSLLLMDIEAQYVHGRLPELIAEKLGTDFPYYVIHDALYLPQEVDVDGLEF